MHPKTGRRPLLWIFIGTIALLHVWLLYLLAEPWWSSRQDSGQALREAGIVMLPATRSLPALSLTDTHGNSRDTSQLTGQWRLVFFGYTYCPDICPTSLAELRRIHQQLPESLRHTTEVMMVSVDPDRDTPEQLRAYLDFFNPQFQGLTGALADIQTLSQALGIPFIPGDTRQPGYTVDHSGNLAIIGPDGKQAGFIRAPLNIPALVEQLPTVMRP